MLKQLLANKLLYENMENMYQIRESHRTKNGFYERSAAKIRDVHCFELLLQLQILRGVAARRPIVRTELEWRFQG